MTLNEFVVKYTEFDFFLGEFMKIKTKLFTNIVSLFLILSVFFIFSCKDTELPPEEFDAMPPVISVDPASDSNGAITVKSGQSFSLSVTATSPDEGTLSYQWYKAETENSDGLKVQNETDDSFSAKHNLKNGETEKVVYYYVVVTNTNNNATGKKTASVTSKRAKVTIKADSDSNDDNSGSEGDNSDSGNNSGSEGDNSDSGDNSGSEGDNSDSGNNSGSEGDNSDSGNDTGDDNNTEPEPDYEISEKSGVMLQGFNWSSAKRGAGYNKQNPSPYWYKWYKVIENQSDAISEKFAYLWCPPPSATDTASSEGYGPTELNDLNNCYGTEAELKSMIKSISPTKAIADIVVNHRAGSTCWGDFTNPDWGVVKGSNYKVICSDDEGFGNSGDSHMKSVPTSMRGNADISDGGYSAYRDLDHTNTTVQQGIVDWMNDVLKPAGFVGWRYDYVKGFAGKYVGQYNAGSNAEFSVGEYWPTDGYNSGNPNAWGSEIKNWISATANGGQRSKAFDFALKGAMNTVFGNSASNVGNSNYSLLAHSSNLMISQPADAVTFIDNHDTGSTQQHWYLDPADIGTAYAFILTHPGYPCVAWQHYFTYAESGSIVDSSQYIGGNTVPGTSNTYREHIDYLIDLRNRVGIEYDDTVVTTGTSSSCYVGEIVGNNGTLLVKIGNVTAATGTGYAGNNPIYAGTNFAIWEKNVDGDATLGGNGSPGGSGGGDVSTGDVTLTVTGPDWTWNQEPAIFCWAWKDGVNGSWYSCTGSGSTIYATVPSDAQYFLIVRCYVGTTVPNWETTGDVLGRIYNKTYNKTINSGQTSYSVEFVEYSYQP